MNADRIVELLHGIGSWPAKHRGDWVTAPCPFAKWTHKSGTDEHPSFAVSVSPDDTSSFNCYTCDRKGSLVQLFWTLRALSKEQRPAWVKWQAFTQQHDSPSEAALLARLDRMSYGPAPAKVVSGVSITPATVGDFNYHRAAPVTLPESELLNFEPPTGVALDYLLRVRKLTPRTIQAFQLGWSPTAGRISLPVRDLEGQLVGITGRLLDTGRCRTCQCDFVPVQIGERLRPRCPKCGHGPEAKFMHTKGFKRDYVFFGEHRVRRGGRVILVEGHFDAVFLQQQGYPALAVMGTSLSEFHVAKIRAHFTEALVFFDDDKAGLDGAHWAVDTLLPYLPTKDVHAQGRDPDELGPGELMDILGPPNPEDLLTP